MGVAWRKWWCVAWGNWWGVDASFKKLLAASLSYIPHIETHIEDAQVKDLAMRRAQICTAACLLSAVLAVASHNLSEPSTGMCSRKHSQVRTISDALCRHHASFGQGAHHLPAHTSFIVHTNTQPGDAPPAHCMLATQNYGLLVASLMHFLTTAPASQTAPAFCCLTSITGM
jgi:hypothetical protein